MMVVVIPKTKQHLFSDVAPHQSRESGVHTIYSDVHDASPLAAGIRFVAPHVDVALVASEGIIFRANYLASVCERFATWADLIGQIDLVDQLRTVDVRMSSIAVSQLLLASKRNLSFSRLFRSRSLMSNALAIRIKFCRNIPVGRLPDGHDWVAFSILLDELHGRGRTAVKFTCFLRPTLSGATRRL
jgi:hypothetical protein